jgi:acetate kinase
MASGLADRIGADGTLSLDDTGGDPLPVANGAIATHRDALNRLLESVAHNRPEAQIAAVGHRVVHGGPDFDAPVRVDDAILARLGRLAPFAPLHQPHNLAGIRAAMDAFPDAPQVACFDTAFHRAHPFVNDTFALPRAYYDKGVRRYGFHGLSYAHVTAELARTEPALAAGRVAIAHLGNGASMCGVQEGRSVASTMGFSALDGLPMGTRCGQLDPGVVLYLMTEEGMDAEAISDLLYKRSGLLGMSGISNDMRMLEASDAPEAREAIDYFTFRIRRELGAMAAALGGIDAVVFTGGIGENAAAIREAVCTPMAWLGLTVAPAANAANDRVISEPDAPVKVLVVPTDEEGVIARATRALAFGSTGTA